MVPLVPAARPPGMVATMFSLAGAALAAGVVHTLSGPDHYLPVIALARAREWSMPKALACTALLGAMHCGTGLLVVAALQPLRADLAAWLLVATGVLLLGLALRRANARPATSLLAVVFLVGPCEWLVAGALLDALWFALATVTTMVVAVAAGLGALARVRLAPRPATALAGATCCVCGTLMLFGF